MKKLFYFLLLTPFLLSACSDDDDKDYFTKDVDYTISAQIIEPYQRPQPKIYVYLNGSAWYIEGYSCVPKKTAMTNGNTMEIYFGELEYNKVDYLFDNLASSSYYDYQVYDAIELPDYISKIILARKGKQDIYNVERSDGIITITTQQKSFSEFTSDKYLTRASNTFGVRFPYTSGLADQFYNYVNASVPITLYEYDTKIPATWYMMGGNTESRIYRYGEDVETKTLIRLFEDFCDEIKKEKGTFNAYFEDWKGRIFNYPVY